MKRIILLVGAFALAGCTLDCGSDETLATVSDIAHREYAEVLRSSVRYLILPDGSPLAEGGEEFTDADAARLFALKPTMVRQLEHDAHSGSYSCSARLIGHTIDPQTANRGDGTVEDDITFSVTPSATDSGEYIIQVFDLH